MNAEQRPSENSGGSRGGSGGSLEHTFESNLFFAMGNLKKTQVKTKRPLVYLNPFSVNPGTGPGNSIFITNSSDNL